MVGWWLFFFYCPTKTGDDHTPSCAESRLKHCSDKPVISGPEWQELSKRLSRLGRQTSAVISMWFDNRNSHICSDLFFLVEGFNCQTSTPGPHLKSCRCIARNCGFVWLPLWNWMQTSQETSEVEIATWRREVSHLIITPQESVPPKKKSVGDA